MTTAVFSFDAPAGAAARVRSMVEATNTRAAAHGLSAYTLAISEPFDAPYDDGHMTGYRPTVTVTITGAVPRHAGWQVLARLDHDTEGTGTGETVMSIFPGLPDPEAAADMLRAHRSRPGHCDGCQRQQHRTATYLAHHADTGAVRQLGSTCVEPYTGLPVKGLEALWRFGKLKDSDWDETAGGGIPADLRVDTRKVLRVAAAVVTMTGGYRGRSTEWQAVPTSDTVAEYFFNRRADALRAAVDADTDAPATAEAVCTWAKSGYGQDSDYRHKLGVLARADTIHHRHLNVLVSAVAGWQRDQAKALQEAAARNSAHQGAPKERITRTVTVTRVHRLEDRYYGYHAQARHLITFTDAENNVYTWFSTASSLPDEGATVTLTGTVTKHDVYRDVAQTVLNRCRLTHPEPAAV